MKRTSWLLAGSALISAAPALAGEEPLYEPAPDWVELADLPAKKAGPPILLYDDQRRIEEGRLWSYSDRAIRIDNPQMLQAIGTLQASWLPDKGDLIVHRVAIIRNGEAIDVLAEGQRFDVLRRERQLEQRMLDGVLTATLPVSGLRVGDILRLTYSTTLSDQALDEEVQTFAPLPTEPFEAGFARIILSWPEDAPVRWLATRDVKLDEPETKDGYMQLDVPLPLAGLPEMPDDAPVRYRMPPLLQASTFADWQEVSSKMATLFDTKGTVAADGPIALEIARIEQANTQPLERAVAALRLVQDEVAYFLKGMEGGNYIPQRPVETWERRYGDCKAKTMLLLAMLREMGIEAEAVLVATATGDALPVMLPMPGDFDHVIVRAVIDGKDYWLDGTSSGASMTVVDEVPAFYHALPLREEGAGLIGMEQRPQRTFDVVTTTTLDHRAGLDVPTLFETVWLLRGPSAAPIRGVIGQVSDDQIDEFVKSFVASRASNATVLESKLDFDEQTSTATVRVSGITHSPWQWDRSRGSYDLGLPSAGFRFNPDRSRAAWRGVPVSLGGPYSEQLNLTVLLPKSEESYALDGEGQLDREIAGVRLLRTSTLDSTRLTVTDSVSYPGGEITPEEALRQRTLATRTGVAELALEAPAGAKRRFDIESSADRKRFEPIEAAYTRLVNSDPGDADALRSRAWFRSLVFDRDGALADLDRIVDLEPSAEDYLDRARLLVEMDRLDAALADTEEAWNFDPTLEVAFTQANILSYLGRSDEAIALLEEQGGDASERRAIATAISDLEAVAGRKEDGLRRIEELLAQRPGDPEMLNAKCWYQATWNFRPEELVELCTEAVESSDWSPPVLDSRAMGYYRLGRFTDALKDLDAALSASPDQAPSLYMRGIVRQQMGDSEGRRDIRAALARQPSLERFFARFGITPDK